MRATRALSLRTRVAAASAAGALLVLVAASVALGTVLARQQYDALDRQLNQVSRLVSPVLLREALRPRATDVPTARQRLTDRVVSQLGASYTAVAYSGTSQVAATSTTGTGPALPPLPPGATIVETDQGDYRVLTAPAGNRGTITVSVGLPVDPVREQVRSSRQAVVLVGLLAVAVAAALGWVLAGPAVRPLRLLRDRAQAIGAGADSRTRVRLDDVKGAREAEELAVAMGQMLDDIERSRSRESAALETARDFAATASHELRTPLTTMRTDLSVMTAHPELSTSDRDEVLRSLDHARDRLEATLRGLEQLARGDLHDATTHRPVDLADLVLRAGADLTRARPAVTVDCHLPETDVVIGGWETGLRLALDNLLTNAVRHGRASRVDVTLLSSDGRTLVMVDDDGPGIPQEDREQVTRRFVRGRGAAPGGSGLGLALVQQQAALHGGRLLLLDSPTGGLRAVLELPAARPG